METALHLLVGNARLLLPAVLKNFASISCVMGDKWQEQVGESK